ncbi:MAG: hypothetical protein H0W72_06575 [Planctomycetes bacterium]|nr:hypothetical protein [Planctomycetota bacterium]
MTKPCIAIFSLLLALLALGGCGDHRACFDVPHCQTFTYLKDGISEAQLLVDEKRLRGAKGVEGVRTRLDGTVGVVTVYVLSKHDLSVREDLLKLGYHRRW